MNEYTKLVRSVLTEGTYKQNRTGVDTISRFGYSYTLENDRYPLLTTKKMDGFRFDSMIHELLWYLSGDHHIRDLREKTSIWDAWADENGNLETAYGRFWRRFPIPRHNRQLVGEAWSDFENGENLDYINWNANSGWTFDQIAWLLDRIRNKPNSRRHVLTAWHPANASASTLPPCHLLSIFNVQNDELHLHLTQRSGDVALGIPFNIASYTLLQRIIARETNLSVGKFHHTIVDAHIYCGKGDRGSWYSDNLDLVQTAMTLPEYDPDAMIESIKNAAPGQKEPYDHVPGLLEQISREPKRLPQIEIADVPMDRLCRDDFELVEYDSHDGIDFAVAE